MPTAPVAVVDALNSLLEAEQNSLFRFMGEGSPYLGRATAEVRRPLADMVAANRRHVGELADLIASLGGEPRRGGIQPEEQYLSYLSLKFLLPKLVDAKELTIRRYENTLRAIRSMPDGAPQVPALLQAQQAEHRGHLDVLKKAAADVIAAAKT